MRPANAAPQHAWLDPMSIVCAGLPGQPLALGGL
jgi:hypothetical protein